VQCSGCGQTSYALKAAGLVCAWCTAGNLRCPLCKAVGKLGGGRTRKMLPFDAETLLNHCRICPSRDKRESAVEARAPASFPKQDRHRLNSQLFVANLGMALWSSASSHEFKIVGSDVRGEHMGIEDVMAMWGADEVEGLNAKLEKILKDHGMIPAHFEDKKPAAKITAFFFSKASSKEPAEKKLAMARQRVEASQADHAPLFQAPPEPAPLDGGSRAKQPMISPQGLRDFSSKASSKEPADGGSAMARQRVEASQAKHAPLFQAPPEPAPLDGGSRAKQPTVAHFVPDKVR
jgi:hypothetical protein